MDAQATATVAALREAASAVEFAAEALAASTVVAVDFTVVVAASTVVAADFTVVVMAVSTVAAATAVAAAMVVDTGKLVR
jgi:hypothetical protein